MKRHCTQAQKKNHVVYEILYPVQKKRKKMSTLIFQVPDVTLCYTSTLKKKRR